MPHQRRPTAPLRRQASLGGLKQGLYDRPSPLCWSPLAVALPRMLEEIETKIAAARPTEKLRLQQCGELIRGLLITPAQQGPEIGLGPPA